MSIMSERSSSKQSINLTQDPSEVSLREPPLTVGETSVFSNTRTLQAPSLAPALLKKLNKRLKLDGLHLLSEIPRETIPVVFFDPQNRGILTKLKYGNEGKSRGRDRSALQQMETPVIREFLKKIDTALIPSGHLFLWMDKFHLCEGVQSWIAETSLQTVDLIVWKKMRMGMGYRSRRMSEYLMVLQKKPIRAKGVWRIHTIRDVWEEAAETKDHPHAKPVNLQTKLIEAVSQPGDVIVDPAAGSFSVLESAKQANRQFLGCDVQG